MPAGASELRSVPLTLDGQVPLWVTSVSSASIIALAESHAATLIEAEKQRVISTMTERVKLLADDLRGAAKWFEDEALERLVQPESEGEKP